MEWNIFNDWIDISLYQQMKDLVFRTSKKSDKYVLKRENEHFELFSDEPGQSAEEEYGLNYPGEILERIGERREITQKQVRALGLELAKTKNLQEDDMFIGEQLPTFLKKMDSTLGRQDPFFLAIRYLMDEKKKKDFYEDFIYYPFQSLAEMLLALSILPEDDRLWMSLQSKINTQLGKKREISVYENSRVYVWLVQHFQFRVRDYRKKDMDAIKYLMKLPFVNAACSSQAVRNKLFANGYSKEEIYFLNYLIIQKVCLPHMVSTSSITGEKLAIEVCRCFLDAEKEYPPQAYSLCSHLCSFYKHFKIKVNGSEGILDILADGVTVKNIPVFRVLYPHIGEKENLKNWKRLNLTDRKWDEIYSLLPLEEYDGCVTETLQVETDAGRMRGILARYRELTGKDYTERFWERYEYYWRDMYRRLCEFGIFPVVEMMRLFLEEYSQDAIAAKEKWQSMSMYMRDYMEHIQSYEAYGMMELLVNAAGISDDVELFHVTELLKSCFDNVKSGWHYNNTWKLDIIRPFLEVEEHQKLFSWIEEYIFQYHTKDYKKFLVHVLINEDNLLWLPKEDARTIYIAIQGETEEKSDSGKLRSLYLTEEECEKICSQEKFLQERKDLKEKMEELKELKGSFNNLIAKSRLQEGQFKKIKDFIFRCSYKVTNDAELMAASYIRALFTRDKVLLYTTREMGELFQLLSLLYTQGKVDLCSIKEYISKVEEKE